MRRRSYSAPRLTTLGSFSAATNGTWFGIRSDALGGRRLF